MEKVNFSNADTNYRVRDKKKITHLIKELFNIESQGLQSINYIICTDKYLLDINKKFLHHDFYTDIITFDLSDIPDQTISEIYISIDRVKENATTINVNEQIELLRVIIHGALHLCGYNDKRKSEITIMREKEDYYLRLFGKHFDSYDQI